MRRKGKKWAASTLSAAAAAVLVLIACESASAEMIDASFRFEGLGVGVEDNSLSIELVTLSGPINHDNIGLEMSGTTLDLTSPFRSA